MRILGGAVGFIVGFAVGILFTEVIFSNSQSWPDTVPIPLGVVGALAGGSLGRRFSRRHSSS